MPKLVVHGATIRCSKGTALATLVVPPTGQTLDQGHAGATVHDFVPMVNVPPFGMCTAPANPQVTTATAAANGTLTPQPCVPAITAPWQPGAAQVNLASKVLLTDESTCTCAWSGAISIDAAASDVEIE